MDEIKDPILQGKETMVSEQELPESVIPDEFVSIPLKIFRVVLAYLKLTWELKDDSGKKIPFNDIVDNTKYLFSREGKYKDRLWKEHSATNLRELFYDLRFPDDYRRAIKNIDNNESNRENGLFGRIIVIKNFLDLVIHYRWDAARKQADKIYDSDKLLNKSFDEIYEMVCIDLFYTLYSLYGKYAFNDNDEN